MIKMKRLIIVFVLLVLVVCGCGKEKVKVISINKGTALNYINDGAVLVDVRSDNEYNNGHIDGAINISVADILNTNGELEYNKTNIGKNAKIIVYCRSGSRSKTAADKLIDLGYQYVYDLGSIENWSD